MLHFFNQNWADLRFQHTSELHLRSHQSVQKQLGHGQLNTHNVTSVQLYLKWKRTDKNRIHADAFLKKKICLRGFFYSYLSRL